MNRGGFQRRSFSRGASSRTGEAPPAYPAPEAKPVPRSHAESARVLRGLPTLWTPAEGWILIPQVRSPDGARIADVIAVETTGPRRRIYVEIKVSRPDWLDELAEPEKSNELSRFCHARVVALPRGEYRRIILGDNELPEGWGVVGVDGGEASLLVTPMETEAEDVPERLWLSMLRSASTAAEREAGPDVGAPMRAITRPRLGPGIVGLICGHTAPAPGGKRAESAPCFSCAAGALADLDVLRAMIDEATPEVRRALLAQIETRGIRG